MELEEMKKVWKQQKIRNSMEYSRSEILILINNKMISFDQEIRSRDRREIIACVIVIAAFSIIFFLDHSIWTRLGCLAIIGGALFIWYKLKAAQRNEISKKSSLNRSLREHLEIEADKVKVQKKLLGSIAWWYIGPMTIGLLFITVGFESGIVTQVLYFIFVLAADIIIWKLNQKAVKDKMEPLMKELREAIEFVKTK